MGDLRKKIIGEVDASLYVPSIGQTVYLIYEECTLYVEKVHSLGKDSFIVEAYKRPDVKFNFIEWRYEDYGSRWFTDFDACAEKILSRFSDEYELKEYDSKWYEVERL